ncbi:MAG: Hpt domain-containing protein [Nitrospirae bacterium]|nr:Hpt domain-containing protein [Nitrospirota bacterium]
MSHDTIFSFEEALARVDHDWDTFQMMAELFVEHGPKDLAETQAALAAQDAAALARSAHRLKGALLQFCAPAALESAKQLEELGKAGDLKSAVEVCAKLEMELLRLLVGLRYVLDKGFTV